MKKQETVKPDFLFEASWEVCNKIGGIYTVLSSKAKVMNHEYGDNHIYVGPDLNVDLPLFTEDTVLFEVWQKQFYKTTGMKTRAGRWNIPGSPMVILVNFSPLLGGKNQFYRHIWNKFNVDSMNAHGDYDEACAFARATGIVIEDYFHFHQLHGKKVVAHFHEWTMGMGVLYLKDKLPEVKTVFTTHATTVGRSIAGNDKALYAYFKGYNGDTMAAELNVQAKHSLEKQAATHCHCFTTVSGITARECTQLLGVPPNIVTPNGFESELVPKGAAFAAKQKAARSKLLAATAGLIGYEPSAETLLIATAGRYEYRNKGIDLFIKSMDNLRQIKKINKEVIAFIMIPANVREARSDLLEQINSKAKKQTPLPLPFITHWLNKPDCDKIVNYIIQLGFTNNASEKVKIIFIPSYLNGNDGIFDQSYYDLLTAIDVTVFPSYYEPWGYTPHESIAFGIPTITTRWAGFGEWAENELKKEKGWKSGVEIIARQEENYFAMAKLIANKITEVANSSPEQLKQVRKNALKLAEKARWEHFSECYFKAYSIALRKRK